MILQAGSATTLQLGEKQISTPYPCLVEELDVWGAFSRGLSALGGFTFAMGTSILM